MFNLLQKKSGKGFTLIELMVVVAIISILASVAIPNFLKFQSKAKQTEARINLKAAYTAAKSKYAERTTYSGFSLATSATKKSIGFFPEANGRYSYSGAANATDDCIRCGSIANSNTTNCNGVTTCVAPTIANSNGFAATSFIISAVANIDVDTFVDGWSITSNNFLGNGTVTLSSTTDDEKNNDVINPN